MSYSYKQLYRVTVMRGFCLLYCFHKYYFHDSVPKLSPSSFKGSASIKSMWGFFFFHRLKEAQENIKKITAEKRVETKKINANSLVGTDLYAAEKWNFLKASLSGSALKTVY